MAGRILIGTSSWADPGFVESWYPSGMPARDRLSWYAERFEAVEVNSSFYAVPARPTVERWAEVTPSGFVFDYKLHRTLSRHAASLESLPPEIRAEARTNERGRVLLDEGLERRMVEATLEAIAPLERAGQARGPAASAHARVRSGPPRAARARPSDRGHGAPAGGGRASSPRVGGA